MKGYILPEDEIPDAPFVSKKTAIMMALGEYPQARKIAVENVIHTWSNDNGMQNALNLEQDRRLYGWKEETIRAIRYAARLCGMPF